MGEKINDTRYTFHKYNKLKELEFIFGLLQMARGWPNNPKIYSRSLNALYL
jgi:hypothetical protein